MQLQKNIQNKLFKYLFVGNTGVGKTSILNRFVNHEFNYNSKSTIGHTKGQKKSILLSTQEQVELNVQDSAGQQRFRTISKSEYGNFDAIFIVFDLTDKSSLQIALNSYLSQIKEEFNKIKHKCKLILVGNKQDLLNTGEYIKVKDGQKRAQQNDLSYYETSALETNNNINAMLSQITEKIIQQISLNNQNKACQKQINLNQSVCPTQQAQSQLLASKISKVPQKIKPIQFKKRGCTCQVTCQMI